MTFWFIRDISMVSGLMWSMVENEANTADLLLIVDQGADYPGTFEKYQRAQGEVLPKLDALLEPMAVSTMWFYEPYFHNVELRRKILGWIKQKAATPTVMAECIRETESP